MSQLKGHIELIGLGAFLEIISRNKREGIFTLYHAPDHKAFFIDGRGMQLYSSTMRRTNPIGKILLRKKLLDTLGLQELLEKQKMLGWKLGKVAVTCGIARPADVHDALREQIQDEIFDMFLWKQALFDFRRLNSVVLKSENPLSSIVYDENITSLMMEALRRADELRMIHQVLNDFTVLQKTGLEIQVAPLGDDVEVADSILPLIDGHRSTRDIVQGSLYSRFSTLRALHLLLKLGNLKVVPKTVKEVVRV